MAQSKNLNMLLIDGTANGSIKCTVSNWIGVAFKIPRDKVESLKNRDELKQSGIYFLFGENEVYIGQAGSRKNGNGILDRIFEHKRNAKKDYWNEAVIFTTSNNSLGATEISFLENKFCNLAINAKRYEVKNSNDPSPGNITEEKEIELEEFAEYVQILMEILGYKVFEPINKNDNEEIILFYLEKTLRNSNVTIKATCKKIDKGYVVLAGSKISPNFDSSAAIIKNARSIAKIDDNNILQNDIFFPHPTPASTFSIGKHLGNGWDNWKTKDGLTLRDFLKLEK